MQIQREQPPQLIFLAADEQADWIGDSLVNDVSSLVRIGVYLHFETIDMGIKAGAGFGILKQVDLRRRHVGMRGAVCT